MKFIALLLFAATVSAPAFAACELQVLAKNRPLKTPLVAANQSSIVGVYQATTGGVNVVVEWDRDQKRIAMRGTDANGGNFEFNLSGVDMLEELDCYGGSAGDSKFLIKCDSKAWREMKAKNGWSRNCSLDNDTI